MSIESDAQNDLELSAEDAEGVAGGRSVAAKRKTALKAGAHAPAVSSGLVTGAPLTGDPTPSAVEVQAELDSDPDC
jgi:hypothetical protein